jgi:hypothetical protein
MMKTCETKLTVNTRLPGHHRPVHQQAIKVPAVAVQQSAAEAESTWAILGYPWAIKDLKRPEGAAKARGQSRRSQRRKAALTGAAPVSAAAAGLVRRGDYCRGMFRQHSARSGGCRATLAITDRCVGQELLRRRQNLEMPRFYSSHDFSFGRLHERRARPISDFQ